MGDTTLAQDLLDAVTDALADVGDTRSVRITTRGSIDPANPGAGPSLSFNDYNCGALLYDYEDGYVDDTVVQQGDRKAILSIDPLDSGVVATILPGARLIDGSVVYSIINVHPIEVAGITVTLILQIRS